LNVLLITDQHLVELALRMVVVTEEPDVTWRWQTTVKLGMRDCLDEGPWDLVLLDLDTRGHPKRLAAAAKLRLITRERKPGAKLITITGLPLDQEEVQARQMDVDAYLRKSMTTQELSDAIWKAMRG
jgi:DNA-binding NarL/FixJ family response regulator